MLLPSLAEKAADCVRELPEFSGVALPDIRKKVTDMLRQIGRHGYFTT